VRDRISEGAVTDGYKANRGRVVSVPTARRLIERILEKEAEHAEDQTSLLSRVVQMAIFALGQPWVISRHSRQNCMVSRNFPGVYRFIRW
jgi:hypothetical protein